MNEIIEGLVRKINDEKEALLKQRLFDLNGVDFDIVKESQRRFPRIKIEQHSVDQSEHYYWNNGTEEGLRIISFYHPIEGPIMGEDYKMTIGFSYK